MIFTGEVVPIEIKLRLFRLATSAFDFSRGLEESGYDGKTVDDWLRDAIEEMERFSFRANLDPRRRGQRA